MAQHHPIQSQTPFIDISKSVGPEVYQKLNKTRVLVIGAGGIGCELLKNLVLCGFDNIDIIDLDTIEVSNLNRQFLFRQHHVGQPKAHIARVSALQFNPNAIINAYQLNIITDPMFTTEYVAQFSMVFSALDNATARQYLSRICHIAQIPVLESGTRGYLGQSYIIFNSLFECYNCRPIPPQQNVFAFCTIRKTPDKPEHCVAWAKHIYSSLFDNSSTTENDYDFLLKKDEDIRNLIQHYTTQGKTYDPNQIDPTAPVISNDYTDETINPFDLAEVISSRQFLNTFPRNTPLQQRLQSVFETLYYYFTYDILNSRSHLRGWLPNMLSFPLNDLQLYPFSYKLGEEKQQEIQPWQFYCNQFITTCFDLMQRKEKLIDKFGSNNPEVDCPFDKDDTLAMSFVTAASNLRMHAYHISLQSEFTIKGIAGNIIHAIATTNAIAAGTLTCQALNLLKHDKVLHFLHNRDQYSPSERNELINFVEQHFSTASNDDTSTHACAIRAPTPDSPQIRCFCHCPEIQIHFDFTQEFKANFSTQNDSKMDNLSKMNPFTHLTAHQFVFLIEGIIGGVVYKGGLDNGEILYGSSPSSVSSSQTQDKLYSTVVESIEFILPSNKELFQENYSHKLIHLLSPTQRIQYGFSENNIEDNNNDDDDDDEILPIMLQPLYSFGIQNNTFLEAKQLFHGLRFNLKFHDDTLPSSISNPLKSTCNTSKIATPHKENSISYPHLDLLTTFLRSAPVIEDILDTIDLTCTRNIDSELHQINACATMKSGVIVHFSFFLPQLLTSMTSFRLFIEEEQREMEEQLSRNQKQAKEMQKKLETIRLNSNDNQITELLSDDDDDDDVADNNNKIHTHLSFETDSDFDLTNDADDSNDQRLKRNHRHYDEEGGIILASSKKMKASDKNDEESNRFVSLSNQTNSNDLTNLTQEVLNTDPPVPLIYRDNTTDQWVELD